MCFVKVSFCFGAQNTCLKYGRVFQKHPVYIFMHASVRLLLLFRYLPLSFFHTITLVKVSSVFYKLNRLTPNDPYMCRTAPLTSKRCILYIYSTNIGTEYFKHALHSPFFSLQNAVCFIMLTCLVPVLFTVYIQDVLKLKKIISALKCY